MHVYVSAKGVVALKLMISIAYTAIPITIGLTKTLHYVSESAVSLAMCYKVLSGRTATRSISTYINTVEGEAKGKTKVTIDFFVVLAY